MKEKTEMNSSSPPINLSSADLSRILPQILPQILSFIRRAEKIIDKHLPKHSKEREEPVVELYFLKPTFRTANEQNKETEYFLLKRRGKTGREFKLFLQREPNTPNLRAVAGRMRRYRLRHDIEQELMQPVLVARFKYDRRIHQFVYEREEAK